MADVTVEDMKARVGQTQVSEWVEVTQAMIDKFAEATGDHQFIHIDPERAKETPFGGTIAHGFLTLSLMTQLGAKVPVPSQEIAGMRMSVNYGGNKVRFVSPVPSGSRIRGHFLLKGFDEKQPGRFQQTNELTVEIEGQDKPALVAEWMSQIFV